MPGTRTAPTVDGSPQFISVSITVQDYTGEQRTDSYQLDADSSNAEIEAFVDAVQALSNATIFRVTVGQVYNSVGDNSNAVEDVYENAKTNVVLLFKNAVNAGANFFIPAPVESLFIDGTEEIDPTNVPLGTLLTSIPPMRTGYSAVSARLTHRRQIGQRVKF